MTIKLNNLISINNKKGKRLGRGSSSGKGGTSGKGHKGQNARSGKGKFSLGFEGGQTPMHRRIPKFGFNNTNSLSIEEITTDMLLKINITSSTIINNHFLLENNLIKSLDQNVKIIKGKADIKFTDIKLDSKIKITKSLNQYFVIL